MHEAAVDLKRLGFRAVLDPQLSFGQLTNERGQSWPSWGPDNDHLVFAGERDGVWNLYTISRRTRAVTRVTSFTSGAAYIQDPVWSPYILNGTGFGFVANHSLVMASYISRANAAVIDLRNLLQQG